MHIETLMTNKQFLLSTLLELSLALLGHSSWTHHFYACNLSVWFSVVFYVVVANSTDLFPLKNYLVNVGEVLEGW